MHPPLLTTSPYILLGLNSGLAWTLITQCMLILWRSHTELGLVYGLPVLILKKRTKFKTMRFKGLTPFNEICFSCVMCTVTISVMIVTQEMFGHCAGQSWHSPGHSLSRRLTTGDFVTRPAPTQARRGWAGKELLLLASPSEAASYPL